MIGDIVYGSLVFKEADNRQTASAGVEIRIVESDKEDNKDPLSPKPSTSGSGSRTRG